MYGGVVQSVCVVLMLVLECVWCSHKNKGGTWSCQLVKRSFLPSIRAGAKDKKCFLNNKISTKWENAKVVTEGVVSERVCVWCVCDSISCGASTSWLHLNQNQKPQNIKCLARNEPNLICNYYCLTRSISWHLSQLTYPSHTHTHTLLLSCCCLC